MEKLIIEGKRELKGAIKISGAKNAALPMLATTILCGGEFLLKNIPRLRDIATFIKLLEWLGATVKREEKECSVDTSHLREYEAPYDLVRTMRASVLILGPLVAREGKAKISLPGGCAIGERPINLHLQGLELMGAKTRLEDGYVLVDAKRLRGANIYFDIQSVTATENLMMAASLAKGITRLKNAAKEPEVVCLGEMLKLMGARIKGLGTSCIEIEGVKELKSVECSVIPDRIEAGTYMMAVGSAGGRVLIKGACPQHLEAPILKLRQMGLSIELDREEILVQKKKRLSAVDVTTQTYPGFPTDLQAQIMTLMAISSGTSMVTETIFENRFMHVAELRRMGADIKIDGKSATVTGVKELIGAPVMATDLRASASLVLAGLAAKGTTEVNRIYHLDRGYEAMEKKLEVVGARIKRVRSESPY